VLYYSDLSSISLRSIQNKCTPNTNTSSLEKILSTIASRIPQNITMILFISNLQLLFSLLIASTHSVSFQTFIPREVIRKNDNTPTTYRRTGSFNNHSNHPENKQFYQNHHDIKHTCCFILPNQCLNEKDGKAQRTRKFTHLFSSNNNIDNNVKLSKGKTASSSSYRFGDISKSFMKKLTKNDDYQWGDISRQLDKQAKKG